MSVVLAVVFLLERMPCDVLNQPNTVQMYGITDRSLLSRSLLKESVEVFSLNAFIRACV